MASSAPNQAFIARAAAILTTAEVAATALDINSAWGGQLNVQLDFTIGSLTNVTVRHYVSIDGVTYYPLASGTAVFSEVITASATRAYCMDVLGGWKFYRATLQGNGTVTSSSATVTYRYLKRASQG